MRGDLQPLQTDDVVGAEPRAEQLRRQAQGLFFGHFAGSADPHLAGLHGQGAAAVHAIALHLAIEHHARQAWRTVGAGFKRHVATLAATRLAVGQYRAARRNIDQTATGQQNVAGTADRHRPAIEVRKAARVVRVTRQVAPQTACLQLHTLRNRHSRLLAC